MKRLMIFILLFNSFSCMRHEDDSITYNIHIENQSTESLTISYYSDPDPFSYLNLRHSIRADAQSKVSYEYIKDKVEYYKHEGTTFRGSGQIIVRFPNDKGYFCEKNTIGGEKCFKNPSRNLLDFSTFQVLKNDYIFVITQEDYENAHELPE